MTKEIKFKCQLGNTSIAINVQYIFSLSKNDLNENLICKKFSGKEITLENFVFNFEYISK